MKKNDESIIGTGNNILILSLLAVLCRNKTVHKLEMISKMDNKQKTKNGTMPTNAKKCKSIFPVLLTRYNA